MRGWRISNRWRLLPIAIFGSGNKKNLKKIKSVKEIENRMNFSLSRKSNGCFKKSLKMTNEKILIILGSFLYL